MADVSVERASFNRAKRRMLFATMFCYLFYYTGRQTFGFAIEGIREDFGLSYRTLGYFGTAMLWAYAIGQAVNGNLGDKFGGRVMMSLGAILSCGLNWIVSFGMGLWSLFIPWTGNGFVQSMGWAPGSRVLSNWFGHRERGIAFGCYLFAAGMSSVLAYVTPIIILKTFGLDWRWIFRLPVLLLLAGGVAYYLIVRNRPEDLGFESPEETSETEKKTNQVDEKESSLSRYMTALKNWRFMVGCVGIGFQSAARYGLLIWVPVYFLGENWKKSGSLWIAVALPIGMAFGAVTGGWVSDKVFNSVRWKVITLFMTLAAAASMIMYTLPRGHWAGIVMLFTCGFFTYGSQSSFWALAPDLLGNKRAGTGVGILDFFAYLFAGLVGPLIGGIIENFNDNTALVFPVVAAASIASAITGLFIRR